MAPWAAQMPSHSSRIRRSTSAWTSLVKLRVSPRMTTSEGIALRAPSVTISVQETTAVSAGWMLRATMVCRPRTIWAATTMGSTTICGWEACPPRPAMRISKLSSLDIRLPTRVLIRPAARPGMLCSPNIAIDGEPVEETVGDHRLRTQPVLLGRLEDQLHRAVEAALAGQDVAGAEHHGHVPVVAAGVHRAVVPRPVRQRAALGQRQPVHVGAQPDRPAVAVRRAAPADGGHQAGAADAARDLQAHRRQLGGQVVARAVLGEAGLGDLVQVVPPAAEPVSQGHGRCAHVMFLQLLRRDPLDRRISTTGRRQDKPVFDPINRSAAREE